MRIDAEVQAIEPHIGVGAIDFAAFALEEVPEDLLEIDVAGERAALLVTLPRWLSGFAVVPLVVIDLQPGREGLVQPRKRQQGTGPHFGFELRLNRAEEAFDQAAGRRVAHAPVQQPNVQCAAGAAQRVGVIDLGVVQVEFQAGPVYRPTAEQRVDEDVEVFPQIVAALDGHSGCGSRGRRKDGVCTTRSSCSTKGPSSKSPSQRALLKSRVQRQRTFCWLTPSLSRVAPARRRCR